MDEEMKKRIIFNFLYYMTVPLLFAGVLYLCSFIFRQLKASENLGAVIAVTYGMLFFLTPVIVFLLMRFSLLRWYVDPLAAAEIPFLFYSGMIVNQVAKGKSLASAFYLINAELADDNGTGFLFLIALFIFALISTISKRRVREENVSYRLLKKS